MLLFLSLLACTKVEPITGIPSVPGGNPLVPKAPLLPWPSDLYLAEDASTVTGRRLVLPVEAIPEGLSPETFSDADGFTRVPAMLAWLEGGYGALPDVPGSIADDSPLFLVDERGERVPVLAELDANAAGTDDQLLVLRPQRTLDADTGYVVVLTDRLSDAEPGKAFRALRDEIPTDSDAVEAQRDDFALVHAAIDAVGLSREEVVLAWPFHTRSDENVTKPALVMHDAAMAFDLPPYTLVEDGREGDNRVIQGTLRAPDFVAAEGGLVIGQDGAPVQQGERDVPFLVTLPDVVQGSRPVIAFGHGFFSSMEEPTWSSLQNSLKTWEMSAISTNFSGFDEDEQLDTVGILASDLNRTHEIVAKQLQSQMHFTLLARVVREQLSTEHPELGDVVYMGISNGGTQGFTILAASPAFSRGAVVVPGGAMSHMLERAVQWNTMGVLFRNQFPDPIDLQLVMTLFQQELDPMDAANFAPRLVHDRYPGRGPLAVTAHEAVGDCQVSNMITEWIARSAGLPVITPAPYEIWGLDTLPAEGGGASSALFVYDENYDPLPAGNVAPLADNGAHETIRYMDAYLAQMGAFLETGKVAQVCDGACDPD